MKFFSTFVFFLGLLTSSTPGFSLGNQTIPTFQKAKKLAAQIHEEHPKTIYCSCSYHGKKIDLQSCGYTAHGNPKRAARLEWEHVVPAEAFGNSFPEWREGASYCQTKRKVFKGRKCAEKNPEFSRMEADLYNLFPEIGELNGLRSNFSMAALGGPELNPMGKSFGGCRALILDRKFEPQDSAKGMVARTYFYMAANYPGRGVVSDKNQKLFEAWDRQFPVTAWECRRAEKIRAVQGNANEILREKCLAFVK